MNPLADLQHQFQSRVVDPHAEGAPAWVSAGGRADPVTQITAYSYAYRARLQEVLEKDFPAVHMAIGDDDFYELTDAYIQAHPSQYFSLREFGQHFPEFIQQPNRPWLSALGSFEWTLCSAFDAADAPRLTEQDIATVAPESWPHLRFATHPSLRVLGFNWNVPEMWKVLTSDAPEAIQATSTEPAYWIVWRDDLITRYRSMPDDEQHALACVRDGGNFEEICIALADFHAEEQIPLRIATLLKTWIGQGLLSGLNT